MKEARQSSNKKYYSGFKGTIALHWDTINELNRIFGVTELFRTYAHQKKLYNRYLSGKSKIIAANPANYGFHQLGVSFDIPNAVRLRKVGGKTIQKYFEQNNFVWYGPNDRVHFTHSSFWNTLRGPSKKNDRKGLANQASNYFNNCLKK